MAPDKIYVKEFYGEISQMWSGIKAKKTTANVQHEYIRKDALLEWARGKKERLGKMFDAMPATAIGVKLDACKEFIDKIESL